MGISLDYSLVDHVMVPLSDKRVSRIKSKGKRPHPPTSSSLSASSDDGLPDSRLPPLQYFKKLPELEQESEEFKQTKGMFKCLGRFLTKKNKKLDKK